LSFLDIKTDCTISRPSAADQEMLAMAIFSGLLQLKKQFINYSSRQYSIHSIPLKSEACFLLFKEQSGV
jgi:hypothetical protein